LGNRRGLPAAHRGKRARRHDNGHAEWPCCVTPGTWEPERLFASLGTNNGSPDIYIRAGVAFITWVRDGFIMFASNAEGPFGTHRFNTGGFGPKVAASATSGVVDHVFVTWTVPRTGGDQVFFAESTSAASFGPWNGAFIAPAGTRAFSVGALATRATVVYGTGANVAARSQA